MTLNIIVPHFSSKGNSTKDLIISTLSEEWPLSIKEIHARLQKNYSLKASYQAVHKSIVELEEDNVLMKNGKNYELNRVWISSVKKFGEQLENKYSDSIGKYEIDSNFTGQINLKFNDVSLFIVTIAEILAKGTLIGKGPNIGVGIFRHLLWPLRFSFADYELFKKMAKNIDKTYAIIKNETLLDKWIETQYLKGGFGGIKFDSKIKSPDDHLIIHGDSIIQINYSEETNKIVDMVYERNHNLTDLFIEYFIRDALKRKADIEVKIRKDPAVATLLREQIISHFKEAQK